MQNTRKHIHFLVYTLLKANHLTATKNKVEIPMHSKLFLKSHTFVTRDYMPPFVIIIK